MIEELLKAVLTNGAPSPSSRRKSASADPLAQILGGILGGGQQPRQTSRAKAPQERPDPGMEMVGDLLGELMGAGGRGGAGSGGLADLLGMVMGAAGGGKSARSQKAANPMVAMLSEKLGIRPSVAQMIVSFFTAKMVSGKTAAGPRRSGFRPEAPQSDALDLDHLLEHAGNKRELASVLTNSGMAHELSQHAGINVETALRGLLEILGAVAKQRRKPTPAVPKKTSLKGLLDTWQVDG